MEHNNNVFIALGKFIATLPEEVKILGSYTGNNLTVMTEDEDDVAEIVCSETLVTFKVLSEEIPYSLIRAAKKAGFCIMDYED